MAAGRVATLLGWPPPPPGPPPPPPPPSSLFGWCLGCSAALCGCTQMSPTYVCILPSLLVPINCLGCPRTFLWQSTAATDCHLPGHLAAHGHTLVCESWSALYLSTFAARGCCTAGSWAGLGTCYQHRAGQLNPLLLLLLPRLHQQWTRQQQQQRGRQWLLLMWQAVSMAQRGPEAAAAAGV
jgi:hypothetical protein